MNRRSLRFSLLIFMLALPANLLAQSNDKVGLLLQPDVLPQLNQTLVADINTLREVNTPLVNELRTLGSVRLERVFKSLVMAPGKGLIPPEAGAGFWIVHLDGSVEVTDVVERLSAIGSVLLAEEARGLSGDFLVPNDYYWVELPDQIWGFNNNYSPDTDISALEAWDITTGNPDQQVLYVDTGIRQDHEEFDTLPGYPAKIGPTYNSLDPGASVEDDYGHGSAVAGIIGALTNNGTGIVGVLGGTGAALNPGSQLVVVKSNTPGTNDHPYGSVADGIAWAINNTDVEIINLSLSGTVNEAPLNLACAYAYNLDIPIVASMGSRGLYQRRYPAGWNDLAIAVASILSDGSHDNTSNSGTHVDVSAPTNQHSTSNGSSSDYAFFAGTSCATPFVTGVVGLLYDAATIEQEAISVAKAEALVRASGHQYPDWDELLGFGYIKSDVGLDILIAEDVDEQTAPGTSPAWYYDNQAFTFFVGPGNEAGLYPGFYNFFRYRGEFSFATPAAEEGERIAVWVDRNNTNGSIKSPRNFEQIRFNYAAPYPPSFSTIAGGSIVIGKIHTYTYEVRDYATGYFLGWWPYHPNNVSVNYTCRGRFSGGGGPELPTAPTDLSGWYDRRFTVVHLQWDRNPPSQNVDKYWLECAEEEGEFEVVAKGIPDPGSGWVTYDHYIWEYQEAEYLRYRVRAHNSEGWGPYCEPVEVPLDIGPLRAMDEAEQFEPLPETLTLEANFPNPFNPDTQIRFGLPSTSRVNLVVYNIRGQVVRTLVEQEMPAGWHTVTWDGKNGYGRDVASGIYPYILQADGERILRKMTLIR